MHPLCKKCVDKNNKNCEGSKVKKDFGETCDFFRDEKNTKLTNPKDAIGSNKMPFHLAPLTACKVISQILSISENSFIACYPVVKVALCLPFIEGALKYGRSNFRAVGVRASIYYDAFYRHINAFLAKEEIDLESGFPHLFKAIACQAVIVDAYLCNKLNDDRMVKGGYSYLLNNKNGFKPSLIYAACQYMDMWFENVEGDTSCLHKSITTIARIINQSYDYKETVEKYTPMIKELKEKHKKKNPKHYTIADNDSID